jgi:glucose-6-phosphate 1-dehydrogenase
LGFEEIFAAWRVIDPLQRTCDEERLKHCELQVYKKGSFGPKAADELIEADGFHWFNPSPQKE